MTECANVQNSLFAEKANTNKKIKYNRFIYRFIVVYVVYITIHTEYDVPYFQFVYDCICAYVCP